MYLLIEIKSIMNFFQIVYNKKHEQPQKNIEKFPCKLLEIQNFTNF